MIRGLLPGRFGRDVLTLATGAALAQFLSAAAAPVLARLFSPAEFGQFALFVAVLSVIGVVACGRYELSVTLPESDADAADVLAIAASLGVASSLLALAATALFRHPLAAWLRAPGMDRWLWLLPVSLLGTAAYQPLTYWALRRRRFAALATSRAAQSGGRAGGQVLAGSLGAGPAGLIVGQILGQFAAFFALGGLLARGDRGLPPVTFSAAAIKRLAVRYARFPKFATGSTLLHSISEQLPALALGHAFGAATVGLFVAAQRLAHAPLNLLAASMSQAFLPRASEARIRGALGEESLAVFRRCVGISLVPTCVLVLTASDLVTIVLGEPWRASGAYLRWLGVWLACSFPFVVLAQLFAVMEKQSEGLLYHAIYAVAVFASLVAGVLRNDASLAVALFAGAGGGARIAACFWLLAAAGNRAGSAASVLGGEALGAAPYVVPFALVRRALPPPARLAVGVVVVGVHAYRRWGRASTLA
ncbi:MAG: oligosaccharide flippase family protein [bacterium]